MGESTKALLPRFDFIMNPADDGFEFYLNSKTPVHEYLRYVGRVSESDFFEFNVIPKDPNFFNFTDFPIDHVGYYQFDSSFTNLKDTIRLMTPFFIDDSEWSRAAHIKIQFDDILQQQNLEQNLLNFHIKFEARPSQWQYYIIPGTHKKLNSPFIESDSEIEFEPAKKIKMYNDENAFLLTSGNTLINLSEKPEHRFTLIDSANAELTNTREGQSKKITILPSANANYFEIISIDNHKQWASPIYVYL